MAIPRNLTFIGRAFGLLLVGRLVLLAFLLEPTNDEGLWQWNARCDAWGLPAHGILHSALSPLNYWLARGLYAIVPPSVLAKRLLSVALVAGAVGLAWRNLARRGHEVGAILLLAWLWFDPYLFRMGSWATLEPLLMIGLVVWHGASEGCGGHWRTALLTGAVTGVLIGIKITIIWLPGAVGIFLMLERRFKNLFVFATSTVLVASAIYASVYLTSDHARFLEIWRQHTASRTSAVAGLSELVHGMPDARTVFYVATALFAAAFFGTRWGRSGSRPSPAAWSIVLGLAALSIQTVRPERYFFPVAWLALMAALHQGWFRHLHRTIALACLLLAVAANLFWWRAFVTHPLNFGGKEIRQELFTAASNGKSIAAPPHLALDVKSPITPTSCGALTVSEKDAPAPEVLVLQMIAADPTTDELAWASELARQKAEEKKMGFYVIYKAAPNSPALQNP